MLKLLVLVLCLSYFMDNSIRLALSAISLFIMISLLPINFRYEKEGEPSQLAHVDIYVSTVDPAKEPPLVTANVILSILGVDYPVDKVSCYLSDDGASMLTFDALSETSEFSRKWVPFCKKFNIEPRAPEMYFAQKNGLFEGQSATHICEGAPCYEEGIRGVQGSCQCFGCQSAKGARRGMDDGGWDTMAREQHSGPSWNDSS
jgi:hypothetical protein